MSSTAMKAPRIAPNTAIQSRPLTCRSPAAIQRLGAGVDAGFDRKARAELSEPILRRIIDQNLDRHALDDLGEVAGRVLRRQQRELRPAARRQAVDLAGEVDAGESVD